MSTVHGSHAEIFGNGYRLTQYLNSAGFKATRDSAETTTLGKDSKTFMPGLRNGTLDMAGVWDGDPGAADEALDNALTNATNSYFSYLPYGSTFNTVCYSFKAFETAYDVNSAVGGVCQNTATMQESDDGIGWERGLVGIPLTTSPTGSVTGSSINNGAASTNGAALVVHATAITGTPTTVKLQDSADNTTWADIANSTITVSAAGSQRIFVAGTVRQYVRAVATVPTASSATLVALINRK